MDLTTFLLAESFDVEKGGPGSGPQGGKSDAKSATKIANGLFNGSRRMAAGLTRSSAKEAANAHRTAAIANQKAGNIGQAMEHRSNAKIADYLSQGHGDVKSNVSLAEQETMRMGRGKGPKE